MFSPTVGKSKFSCALTKIYFYDLEVSGNFSVPKRILRDTETGLFIRHKTGSVLGERGRMGFLHTQFVERKLIGRN